MLTQPYIPMIGRSVDGRGNLCEGERWGDKVREEEGELTNSAKTALVSSILRRGARVKKTFICK